MKIINRKSLFISGLCAVALSFGTVAYAEKGAEALVKLTKSAPSARVEAAAPMAHKCALCTDMLVTVVDKATKGPNHLITKVSRHNCSGCNTKIITEGTGKMKKDVAMHTCAADVKATCCATN